MDLLYKILVIVMIVLTLTKLHKIEQFYLDLNLPPPLTKQTIVSDSAESSTRTPTSTSGTVSLPSLNNLDEKQMNQGWIFDKCMNKIAENNNARAVLLLDAENIYTLQYFKEQINELMVQLNVKLEAERDTVNCSNFKNSYCVDNELSFNADPSLYTITIDEFNNKLNACFSICSDYDIEDIRKLRSLLYDTLFDIFLRYEVLEKIDGDIVDEVNLNRYDYLIKYNKDEAFEIVVNLNVFSKESPRHSNFVKEIHSFHRIVALNAEKIDINKVILEDKKLAIRHNFTINKYKS